MKKWFKSASFRLTMALMLMHSLLSTGDGLVSADNENITSSNEYQWVVGPSTVSLDGKASLELPANFSFLSKTDTQRSMLDTGNQPNGNEIGSMYSNDPMGSWSVIFEYVQSGHIHDDDENQLDAHELLSNYIRWEVEHNRDATEENELHVTGWEVEPEYSPSSHQLIYALGFKDSYEQALVNYNVNLLTREGYITAILVTQKANLEQSRAAFEETVLQHLTVNPGYKYEDYNDKTDQTSRLGLNSLVLGGIPFTAEDEGIWSFLKHRWYWGLIGLILLFSWVRYQQKRDALHQEETQYPVTREYNYEEHEQQHSAEQNELTYYRSSDTRSKTDNT
ncbi:DUF2167 domain-containing protein [Paenibacillus sp. TSA_86.1]|uniref:DUF2167 domain-containing protein n=1 Tax=Paenibacillus sp. TSA_86.1 TaxID=3415649 RepID=UPI0040452F1A